MFTIYSKGRDVKGDRDILTISVLIFFTVSLVTLFYLLEIEMEKMEMPTYFLPYYVLWVWDRA